MRVRALTCFASADGGHAEGEVFEAAPLDASEWLRAGLVERLAPPTETATAAPPEAGVTRRGRR